MPPPNLVKFLRPNMSTLPTKMKRVIAWWIALLIVKDGGCSLIFAKVTNPNIVKVVVKPTCITHLSN